MLTHLFSFPVTGLATIASLYFLRALGVMQALRYVLVSVTSMDCCKRDFSAKINTGLMYSDSGVKLMR